MDVLKAIYDRRAVRDYTQQAVDKATLLALIEAAIQAPSAMNLQPWSFVAIAGRERLLRLSQQAKRHLLAAMATGSPLERFKERLADPRFDIFHGAPALVVISATSPEPGASEDCALAAQNFMLAAHAKGLGTCWIGFARAWLNQKEAKGEHNIPFDHAPVAPIIVGHPARQAEPHGRGAPAITWIGI
jgi:nitroreductase